MMCFCGTNKAKKLFICGDDTIVECLACQQVRTESQLQAKRKNVYGKGDISVYVEKEDRFRELFCHVISFIQRFINSGTLVDIGAGVGLLVDEAKKAGFDAIGFEPSKAAVLAAKKCFGVTLINYEFHKATPWPLARGGLGNPKTWNGDDRTLVDTIVVNHVLEHVENPKILLSDVADSIQNNGFLFIGVPNFDSFMAQLKKGRWQSLIPDQHRWHFTLSTLDALVTRFGFQRVGATYENHDRFMHPWWKRPAYAILDTIAWATGKCEAMLVAYRKIT